MRDILLQFFFRGGQLCWPAISQGHLLSDSIIVGFPVKSLIPSQGAKKLVSRCWDTATSTGWTLIRSVFTHVDSRARPSTIFVNGLFSYRTPRSVYHDYSMASANPGSPKPASHPLSSSMFPTIKSKWGIQSAIPTKSADGPYPASTSTGTQFML